jgi:hypothetical protein
MTTSPHPRLPDYGEMQRTLRLLARRRSALPDVGPMYDE